MKLKNIIKSLLIILLVVTSFYNVVVAQVVFSVESKVAEPGEAICLNVKVNNFKDILSAQLTINWDANILSLDSIGGFGMASLSLNNFGTNKANLGIASLSWIDFSAKGKTLNNGSVLFKICFKAIGLPGSSSIVNITDNPIQIEITDLNSNGDNIGAQVNSGTVTISSASSALYFDSTLVTLPGHTCNRLIAKNLQSINKLTGTIDWDPTLLSFDSICCLHPDINYSSINTFQSNNGVILLNIDQGTIINLNNNKVLFGVCFNAFGKPTDVANIELNSSWFPYELNALPPGPVKVSKGLVSFQLKELQLNGFNLKAKKGDLIEYPLISSNQVKLQSLQGSLQFDPTKISYTGFRKAKLDEMSKDSLNLVMLANGKIGYKWATQNNPVSLQLLDTLFFIKFQVLDSEGTTYLSGNNDVLTQTATIQENSNKVLPLFIDTTSIIILPPDLQFQGKDSSGTIGDTVCSKIFVNDFSNVNGFKLSLDYDANLLKAIAVIGINMPNDPILNINFNIGKINLQWKDYQGSFGLSLNNGDALLESCFELIGPAGTEASLSLDSTNSIIYRSDYPQDSFHILMKPAKISILGSAILSIMSFIKNNPCEGDAKGNIALSLKGGKSPFKFGWDDGSNSQNRDFLKDGTYQVSINDSSTPAQYLSASFEIKHYAANPIVNPISDTQIKCPGDSIEVNTNTGNYQLSWSGPNGGIHALNDGKAIINLAGTYSVKLYDPNTSCYSLDTFEVFPAPILEPANAGLDQHACEEVLLKAIQSDNIFGHWTSTGNFKPKDPNQKITEVVDLESGPNAFIWTISTKECPAYDKDTVWVFVPFPPIALDDNLNIHDSKKINILENDLTNNGAFTLVYPQPLPQEVAIDQSGLLRYNGNENQLPLSFQYKLCSSECPSLCTNASVKIFSDTSVIHLDSVGIIPNVISPNNDGFNDYLSFPQLDVVKYPNAKIIIFDRSGRVVYRNNHYQNDWNGIDNDLQELSMDTYYYVLWISFSDGKSIKGPITILR